MVTVPRVDIYPEILPELENVRSALEWSFGSSNEEDVVRAARIIGGLRLLWLGFERYAECRRWIELALSKLDVERHAEIAARLHRALIQSLPDAAIEAAAERAMPIFMRIGDREGVISLNNYLIAHLCEHGKFDKAEAAVAAASVVLEDSAFAGTSPHFAFLANRAVLYACRGRFEEARQDLFDARHFAAAQKEGHQEQFRLSKLAKVEALAGNFETAVSLSEAICRLASKHEDTKLTLAMRLLGFYRLLCGRPDESIEASKNALQRSSGGLGKDSEIVMQHIAAAAAMRGATNAAARLFGFLNELYRRTGYPLCVFEQRSYGILESLLADRLATSDFLALVSEGAMLSFSGALDEALAV